MITVSFPIGRALVRLAGACLLSSAAMLVAAQDIDPPGRAGRVALVEGTVWVYTPDSGEWIAAQRNQVLTGGDRIATDPGARAELEVGSTTVRLDGQTELDLRQLDDERLTMQLPEGALIVRVRDPSAANGLQFDTDVGRFLTLAPGVYRLTQADSRSDLTVYAGAARYEGRGSALPVEAGQRAQFWIDPAGAAQYSTLAPANDAFAAWSSERDRRESAVVAERYVAPEMTGVADLDAYGRWEQSTDYGPIWVPVVAAGWAPYSQGHWAWVAPWGWTWIDDAPWGFAPFHYGRWVHDRDRWCWTPGQRSARPVYAPALVGWIGGPQNGGPGVGWVPLAPREVYVPSYRVSSRYAERLNIAYVGNSSAIHAVFENRQGPRDFENRRYPGAVTVVPAQVLTERRPVGPAAAQFRQTPWAQEMSSGRGRVTPLLAPPVSGPPVVPHAPNAGAVRPPPGFPARPGAAMPQAATPAQPPSPRDRSADDRGRGSRESHDAMRPNETAPQAPTAGMPPFPAPMPLPRTGTPPLPSPTALPQAGVPPLPSSQGRLPNYPGQANIDRSPIGTSSSGPAGDPRFEARPGVREGNQQAPVQNAVPQPGRVPPSAQQAPTMHPMPVYRGEDRRIEQRPAPPQAPQLSQPMAPAPAQVLPARPQAPVQPRPEFRPQAQPQQQALPRPELPRPPQAPPVQPQPQQAQPRPEPRPSQQPAQPQPGQERRGDPREQQR